MYLRKDDIGARKQPRKKEEGRRKKEEGRRKNYFSTIELLHDNGAANENANQSINQELEQPQAGMATLQTHSLYSKSSPLFNPSPNPYPPPFPNAFRNPHSSLFPPFSIPSNLPSFSVHPRQARSNLRIYSRCHFSLQIYSFSLTSSTTTQCITLQFAYA